MTCWLAQEGQSLCFCRWRWPRYPGDFQASGIGQALIDLSDFGDTLKFKSLHIFDVGSNIEIRFGYGDLLVLKGVDASERGIADFLFKTQRPGN